MSKMVNFLFKKKKKKKKIKKKKKKNPVERKYITTFTKKDPANHAFFFYAFNSPLCTHTNT